MSFAQSAAIFGVLALLSQVQAHGRVTGVIADGEYYRGYDPSFRFQNPPPVVAGWTADNLDNGFVSDYDSPDIICHKSATPGGSYIQVTAGSSVELQWTIWPESHHGPVMDFLAACGDDCTTVDKTKLLFNKIDESGLIDGSAPPGKWASDDLIANNNSWTVTIPSSIAPGKYILRHDTIALHAAFDVGGSQAYPQCFNLEISGSGSNSLSTGIEGTSLYNDQDPGILVNIYQKLTSYVIPGPPLLDGSSSGSQPSATTSAAVSTTTSAVGFTTTSSSVASFTTASTSSTTTKSSDVEITSSVIAPTAVISTTEAAPATSGRPSKPVESATAEPITTKVVEPEPETSAPAPPPANTSVAPIGGEDSGPSQSTSPISFTSTVTGRIGKPTKFTCYIEE